MSVSTERAIADVTGPAAMPRRNGELVFDAPWESRAFGMAVALADEALDWSAFRAELIAEIARWDGDGGPGEGFYYERWLSTLETVVIERGLISRDELKARMAELELAQAHEHDH